MTATPDAGVVNDYLILQYATLIFGLLPPAASRRRGPSKMLALKFQRRAFVVTDSTGQKLAYVYFEDEPWR